MFEYFSKPYVLGFVLLFILHLLYRRHKSHLVLPDLPWLNTRDGELFTRLRARYRSTVDYKQTIHQAYELYSKRGQSCILPGLNGDEILLPTSTIPWLINQPESILSADEPHRDTLQTDFTFAHPFVIGNPLHHETVKSELTRQLGNLTEHIVDELGAAFDDVWGADTTQWRDVCVFETMLQVIARISNRVFVGLPWCRNQALLNHGIGFATAVPVASVLLRQIPTALRPLTALLITRPNQRHTKGFARIIRPEIRYRQSLLDSGSGDLEKKIDMREPDDFLQWSIRRARDTGTAVEQEPDIIAERILAVNFAAIHTSTFSITNTIFDLLASDPSLHYISQLRAEARSNMEEDNGAWTKQGLARMYKTDSALRESSRLGSFLGAGLTRKVVCSDGFTAPNGTFCPSGSTVSVPTNGVHNDPEYYPDAATYQPFRFSSQREDGKTGGELLNTEDYIRKANLSFVSTSPEYHPFGHGRRACPGRFFAANELKLLLSYIVLNYELQMLPSRPVSRWVGTSLVPPMKETIRIRRRPPPNE